MVLAEGKDVRLCVSDIETLKECIDLGFYNPDTQEWYEFEISKYKNDLYKFITFYSKKNWDYISGFNYRDFDAQVIQFIINSFEDWFDLNGAEVAEKVYAFTQKLIDDRKYGLFCPYKESQFEIPVIDVYLIFGLDNEARISSLKKCEFQIDYPSVEEMPIHHSAMGLSEEQVAEIKSYRRNDVMATYELLKMAIGISTNPIYDGNNQIEMRFNIQNEFGINCLNYSDIKIGDEILKHSYAAIKGLKLYELPRKGTFRKEIDISKCIPEYISFKTPELQKLHASVTKLKIGQFDKLENKFKFYNTEYIQALGGLHSVNKNQRFAETADYEIHDYDVASMYPAIIVENNYYPYHLGKELLAEYKSLYHKRVELKPLSKKDKKVKGIVDGLKLALNAVFGKMGSPESWLYDKQALLSVTLTGQFCLLMLIEEYELNDFQVISANTDGVTVLVRKDRVAEIEVINKAWEEKTKFMLEKARYKEINYSTVNDYIAITLDEKTNKEKVKTKGDYIKDFELWKNKSYRVIPLALEAYFIRKENPIEFIRSHKNIYDFCIMARATGENYIEMQKDGNYAVTAEALLADGWKTNEAGWTKGGEEPYIEPTGCTFDQACRRYRSEHPSEVQRYKKLVRYYLTTDGEWQIYKRGTGTTGKPMNIRQNAPDSIGNIYSKYFNKFEELQDYQIDYNRYILKTLERIDAIEKTRKAENFLKSINTMHQQTLF